MKTVVVTTHLEMRDRAALRPSSPSGIELVEAQHPSPALGRYLYTAVGGDWYWLDRLSWSWQEWHERLARAEVQTWIGYVAGTPAGYFELERQFGQAEESVEIVYFGLVPGFLGRGHGGYLLTRAVEEAWRLGAARVWLHTCTLDGPHAQRNYEKRGFVPFKTESKEVELPDTPPGPWPGARS